MGDPIYTFWPRIDIEVPSLEELNGKVQNWLAAVYAKALSGFNESCAARFAHQQQFIKPVSALFFDARREIAVQASRKSMIRPVTIGYSVPPECVGQILLLKAHPFHAEAKAE